MLIYLDHAHIAALDDLLRRDPGGFGEFLAFWLDQGCELVVSRAHLHEIGQSVDSRDMERRLDLLRYFAIRSGREDENVDWVIIREILHQTLSRLRGPEVPPSAVYAPLREELYKPVEHDALERFVRRGRAGWLEELRSRRQLAEFENRRLALQELYTKLTGKKEAKWDPEGWRVLAFVQSQMPSITGDAVGDMWNAEVRTRSPECLRRAKRKRQALVCMYDLKGLAILGRAPEEDLARIGFFRALGNHWVAPHLLQAGFTHEAIASALAQFDPYDAPAISASLAVERGRKSHDREFEASDYMDVDHVLWAAHTDLAFVDKRTHGFLLQAESSKATATLLSRHRTARFARVASLEDVKACISALAQERAHAASEYRK